MTVMDIRFDFMVIHPGGQAVAKTFGDGNDAKAAGLSLLLEEMHLHALQANNNPHGRTTGMALAHAETYASLYMDLESVEQSEWLATDLFNQTWCLNIYMDDDAPDDLPPWWGTDAFPKDGDH